MLPLRPRRFVMYYLGKAAGNGTLAATLAGYRNPAVAAHRLIRNDKVIDAINAKLVKAEMDADEVLARLSDRASSSAEDFLKIDRDRSPDQLPSLDLRKAKRRGMLGNIKKIKANRSSGDNPLEVVEVELHDALPALALLAKYHGLDKPEEKPEAKQVIEVVYTNADEADQDSEATSESEENHR